MAPEIKELGGLPEGDIKLLISDSKHEIKGILDAALNTQELRFDGCLKEQDRKIDDMQQNISILVGNSKLEGLVQSTKKTIESLAAKHETWHEEDLTFRKDITTRVETIEKDSGATAEQVANIRWLVLLNHYSVMWIVKCFNVLKEQSFFKLVLSIGVIWLIAHFAPHLYEAIKPYLSSSE